MADVISGVAVRDCRVTGLRRRLTASLLLSSGFVLASATGCSGETKPDEGLWLDTGVDGETSSGASGTDTIGNGVTNPGGSTKPGATPGGPTNPGNESPGPSTGTDVEPVSTEDGAPTNVTPTDGFPTAGPDDTSTNEGQPTGGENTEPVQLPNDGELRAFPGATGFAAMASGGRGGQVIKVTTLADSGPGSFREAISTPGPRIIVFAVSGVIQSDSVLEIYSGDVTIAGQTAPGGGITIQGRLWASYDESVGNIVMRHVRIRPQFDGSEGSQFDALQFSVNHHVIFDHVSVGFGVDETMDFYGAHNVTVQWSTIEDPRTEGHEEGEHNYGLINGPYGQHIAVHHNLFAHAKNRNPAIANGPADILNNVMYDVGVGFVHHNPATGQFRLIGNYFKDGPSADLVPFYFDDYTSDDLSYYVNDNWVQGDGTECDAGELDNPWQSCYNDLGHDESFRSDIDFDFSDVDGYRAPQITSPQQAYEDVLAKVGAFPRDVVTRRAIQDLQDGTGEWGMPMPGDLMEGLVPTQPPTDADNDGMADTWETSHGLNPVDGDDHTTIMESGYTAIEEYINELAERLIQ